MRSNLPHIAVALAIGTLLVACGTQQSRTDAASAPAPTAAPRPVAAAPPGWTPIGASLEGRPLLAAQAGNGPLRVYLIGGIHGDETEGRSALESLKAQARVGATLRVLRDLNPDGTARRSRGNASGVDLNRNWPAANFQPWSTGGPAPLSEPETRAIAQDLREFRPALVIVLHSLGGSRLVNYDGPAEGLASAFARAAQGFDSGWSVVPDMGYPTPGSLGSYLGVDRNIPVLTIEFERGQDEASAAASLRRGLEAVIAAAAAPRVVQRSSEDGNVQEHRH